MPDTDSCKDSERKHFSKPRQALNEIGTTIRDNKIWTLVAAMSFSDAIFAISDLATKSGILSDCEQLKLLKNCKLNTPGVLHLVGWAIIPPVFFYFEALLKHKELEPTGEPIEDARRKALADRFKAAQDLASKVWAGVFAAILFLAPK